MLRQRRRLQRGAAPPLHPRAAPPHAGLWLWLSKQSWLHRALGGRLAGGADDAALAVAWGNFNRNVDRREAVSAGAAAGIAAAFGAPIGGVLFSLEEACSVWSRRIAWRCFLASAIAVLTHELLNPHAAGGMLASSLRPVPMRELPAILAVSAGGGLLVSALPGRPSWTDGPATAS